MVTVTKHPALGFSNIQIYNAIWQYMINHMGADKKNGGRAAGWAVKMFNFLEKLDLHG